MNRVVDVRLAVTELEGTVVLRGLAHAIERDVDFDIRMTYGIAFPQSQLSTLELRCLASHLYTNPASCLGLLARPVADDVVEWSSSTSTSQIRRTGG